MLPKLATPDRGPLENVGRRGASRLRLSIPARLITTCETQMCVLLDLSRTGARIGLARPLNEGASGYLRIEGMEMFVTAIRRTAGIDGGTNGLAFDLPIAHDAVVAMRHYAASFERRKREDLRDQVRRWVTGCN
ncbi:PilZ domain-containing protein [Porphyrobacter sp. MBR-155]|jgi:hypothetical protein|uniref:PilZ domain-containing protein n=1 Tax=Porphyrobacter sp. MBR-155 TaxID=3156464 RepID=UPI00339A6ABB